MELKVLQKKNLTDVRQVSEIADASQRFFILKFEQEIQETWKYAFSKILMEYINGNEEIPVRYLENSERQYDRTGTISWDTRVSAESRAQEIAAILSENYSPPKNANYRVKSSWETEQNGAIFFNNSVMNDIGSGVFDGITSTWIGIKYIFTHPVETYQNFSLFFDPFANDEKYEIRESIIDDIKNYYEENTEARFTGRLIYEAGTILIPSQSLLKSGKVLPNSPKQKVPNIDEQAVVAKVSGNFKYETISKTPAKDVNKWWENEMGYSQPPYKPGTVTQEIKLRQNTTFVRVYDGENSGMYGGRFMNADDIKGLTPQQIQDKFALPTTPKYLVDVELGAGTKIRTGTANSLFGFEGGGQQFDLMGQRVGKFTNSRSLP